MTSEDEQDARPTGPAAAEPGRGRPQVLYITGSGRSGSTLLERVLGGAEGYVNVGELIELFRWVAPQDERCGCGEAFSACPFWTEVGEKAFGGWSPQLVGRIADLQRMVARQRKLPQLLVRPQTMAAELAEYREQYRRLYAALREVSGGGVVVDASKWPAQGLALARSDDLDVRLLHLVRDVRGVAFSWAKSGVARPHAVGERATMAVHPVARTAARWSAFQGEAEVIGRVVPHYHRLRYEDFVADPSGTVVRARRSLGLVSDSDELPHLEGSSATLGASHGIGGNPSRFRVGVQTLRLDEEWRRAMSTADRRTATLVALPVLARYGYLRTPAGR